MPIEGQQAVVDAWPGWPTIVPPIAPLATPPTVPPIAPWHRHQLVRLDSAAWLRLCARDWEPSVRACLRHWAVHDLPLVVARQRHGSTDGDKTLDVALPAPQRWGRRRIALRIERTDVCSAGEFPPGEQAGALLPAPARAAWRRLCARLRALGMASYVYGSFGWQLMTGLDHVRQGSDIDLWLDVRDARRADAACAALLAFGVGAPRLDGELVFAGGRAVAWREWCAWRSGSGSGDALLVKTLDQVLLARGPAIGDALGLHEAAR